MEDPYKVLGIGPDADPDQIRGRYLALVRQHPPERDPEKFAAVREAYDQLRDPVVNLERRLFSLDWAETIETLLVAEGQQLSQKPIPTEVLLSLGNTSS